MLPSHVDDQPRCGPDADAVVLLLILAVAYLNAFVLFLFTCPQSLQLFQRTVVRSISLPLTFAELTVLFLSAWMPTRRSQSLATTWGRQ